LCPIYAKIKIVTVMHYNIPWLQSELQTRKVDYLFFWGHRPERDGRIGKSCLSQWWLSKFTHEGKTYASAEHWMMACKARLFGDVEMERQILAADSPATAKKLGRKVRNFDPVKWDAHKFEFVQQGNVLKFGQDEALKQFLLSTGDKVLVEASPVDNIWGIGLSADAPGIEQPSTWRGENLLGFALMVARDVLRGAH
jgi:ribA/ribD-fused uncharacterized protein